MIPDGNPDQITFRYSRTVEGHDLALVHDDGDLRFGANDGAGELDVSLTTRPSDPFVVEVDESQQDPLLRVAMVSQPVMDLDGRHRHRRPSTPSAPARASPSST